MKFSKRQAGYLIAVFVICYFIQANWSSGANLINTVWTASQPFLIGAALAYIVNIVMTAYEHLFGLFMTSKRWFKLKRLLAMVSAYLSFIAVIVWLFSIVIPDLIASISSLMSIDTEALQQFLTDLYENKQFAKILDYLGLESDLTAAFSRYSRQILTQVLAILTGLLTSVTSIASTLVNVFVSLVFSIYVLSSKDQLQRQSRLLIDTYFSRYASTVYYVTGILHQRFRGFFAGQTIEAFILATLCTVGMMIFNFPFATTVGILVGFTNIIPVIGAYLGGLLGTILVLTQSPKQAFFFLIFLIILQQFESNIIYPKVVGGSIGLPAIWVLFSVIIGGSVFGIIGMLIAVPLSASIYQIIKDNVRKRQSQQPSPER
ncbi:AI-2E family transporter [Streptococcus chenjunshii]|uniref:AI-2E family transporter n=1 Tax=Streptococcus chenjunshii TaxID=2173853 RepID=A0A372KP99_9STRE|nr:AI-2E family transporter [Streptococcus chenjunshii]AXQ78639.1 AI-2E family transporter [Streptococcus chenjunshii]RFU51897.1 AI-2E family transporter [Streptococcus chenjunshii]RFU54089.1 AI-2E family transporter [Streptococcus chenjunshii]